MPFSGVEGRLTGLLEGRHVVCEACGRCAWDGAKIRFDIYREKTEKEGGMRSVVAQEKQHHGLGDVGQRVAAVATAQGGGRGGHMVGTNRGADAVEMQSLCRCMEAWISLPPLMHAPPTSYS